MKEITVEKVIEILNANIENTKWLTVMPLTSSAVDAEIAFYYS